MPAESEIQDWIVSLVAAGTFLEHINGIPELRHSLSGIRSGVLLPSFHLDHLLRKRALTAADRVLRQAQSAQIVSERRNISLSIIDGLLPDLLLFDRSSGAFICVELKASARAGREALSELSAYEQEIRNHLPLISDLEISHIIVSTDFTALLEHGIASSLMWSARSTLALRAHTDGPRDAWRLSIVLPRGWTQLNLPSIPAEHLDTITICLYPKDGDHDAKGHNSALRERVVTFQQMIARDGDRNGSHGFSFVWQNLWDPDAPWQVTVATLKPHTLLEEADLDVDTRSNPLSVFLLENRDALRNLAQASTYSISDRAVQWMRNWSNVQYEALCDWNESLSIHRFCHIPVYFDAWGEVGEHIREVFVHPLARSVYAVELQNLEVGLNDAGLGFCLTRDFMGYDALPGGQFSCTATLQVGAWLGLAYAALSRAGSGLDAKSETMMVWFACEFSPYANAIAYRTCASTRPIPTPPKIDRSVQSVRDFIIWYLNDFLSSENSVHQLVFRFALDRWSEILQTPVAATRTSEQASARLGTARAIHGEVLAKLCRIATDSLLNPHDDVQRDDVQRSSDALFVAILSDTLQTSSASTLGVLKALEAADPSWILEVDPCLLAATLDLQVSPLVDELAAPNLSTIDLDYVAAWIRSKSQGDGLRPCLRILADGRIGAGWTDQATEMVVGDDEVLIQVDHGGACYLKVVKLADLPAALASRELSKGNEV